MTTCNDSYMNTNTAAAQLEVKFTAKRACYWNAGNRRWQGIGRDKATVLIALGQAVDITGRCI